MLLSTAALFDEPPTGEELGGRFAGTGRPEPARSERDSRDTPNTNPAWPCQPDGVAHLSVSGT